MLALLALGAYFTSSAQWEWSTPSTGVVSSTSLVRTGSIYLTPTTGTGYSLSMTNTGLNLMSTSGTNVALNTSGLTVGNNIAGQQASAVISPSGFLTLNTASSTGNAIGISYNGYNGTTFTVSPTGNVTANLINSKGVIVGNPSSVPIGYNLYVTGGILTEKVKVAINGSANWADFVFDKDYKLKSLSSIESFINTNKHLPDVPSAKAVSENGVDVAKMDAVLLQKVEELTLYLIQLQKQNTELAQQVEKLKK